MEPVFTLPYSEYAVANLFQTYFKSKDGYSIYVPTSRQEKGVDLILTKRLEDINIAFPIQVKASRTYTPLPPKRTGILKYNYYTWFNTFVVPDEADIFALIGLYPPEEIRTKKTAASWWSAITLIFFKDEMKHFISNVKTKSGTQDKMFGFGFNSKSDIFLTRGGEEKDYTNFLFENRIDDIKNFFNNKMSRLNIDK